MRIGIVVGRLLMGLPLLLFGANAFIGFMPMPNEVSPEEGGFSLPAFTVLNQLWDSGFIMHSVCVAHVLAGAALLVNRFVPLALAIHLPVSLMMSLFHVALEPATGIMAYAILVLNVILMVAYRDAYVALLKPRHDPT